MKDQFMAFLLKLRISFVFNPFIKKYWKGTRLLWHLGEFWGYKHLHQDLSSLEHCKFNYVEIFKKLLADHTLQWFQNALLQPFHTALWEIVYKLCALKRASVHFSRVIWCHLLTTRLWDFVSWKIAQIHLSIT